MSTTDADALEAGDIFEILSNKRRRMVLYYLRQQDDTVEVRGLAKEIAALENDVPVDELTSQQRKRVYVSLYQTHLPKMADAEVIDYDKDSGRVALTTQATSMDRYLTTGDDDTYSWQSHYVVLTAVSAVTVVLSVLNAPVFGRISAIVAGGIAVSLYAVSGVVQYWYEAQKDRIPIELQQYE